MNKAYLLIGGNIGDRKQNLQQAFSLIEANCGRITKFSSVYETAPWGKTDQPAFLNQALEIETDLQARQLLRKILKMEKMMGRTRKEKYEPRIIDIDLILFNDEIHNYPLLTLPHPELHNRRFALLPLAEIASDKIHPVFRKNIGQLLAECADQSEAVPIT